MAARILIVSPIPSHPQDQGNSARIYTLARALQAAGFIVHFLYCQNEGLTDAQRQAMTECWDHFHTIPPSWRDTSPTGEGTYLLDDWDEPAVHDLARALHRKWRFAAVLANYVWFSGVLDAFGPGVIKVLDTHDVFGDRHLRFLQAGLTPEWFWTTQAEEARGLARADIVLAIQEEEAAQLRALGHADVRVIGHLIGRRVRHARAVEVPTIGYLASGNPLNVNSFEVLQDSLAASGGSHRHARFVLAGAICDKLRRPAAPFEAMGRVDHVDLFYDSVDVVVNPMTTGTGLKIKSVEAVFEGLPLIATETAMTGLPAAHPLHRLAGADEVARVLLAGGLRLAEREELAQASAACATAYAASVRHSLDGLVRSLAG